MAKAAVNKDILAELSLIEACNELRALFLECEEMVLSLKEHRDFKLPADEMPRANGGEAIANIMLSYRHLEDARMRLGKVIQAMDGGTSVYDKEKSA